ncbi:MAG: hypothetical protein RBU23_06345 [Candidatus Auribacterota bacterium]|jgi:hypothetical protein|nr:hypothetical protein [Candidatus Auribacterota bacterium]
MILNYSLFHFLRKNIEKLVFFTFLAISAVLISVMIFTLPYFQNSLFSQKVIKKSIGVKIEKEEYQAYYDLFAELKQPVNYTKQYTRDPFSPDMERKECPACAEMVSDKLDICPFCEHQFDSDGDGMPDIWEKRHNLNSYDPNDAYLDKDGDNFTNLSEYQQGTNPNDPMCKPEEKNPIGKYKLVRIYQKTLDLLFDGYMHLPDGSYSFVINYGSSSHFKKIGDNIKGYTIVDFEKKIVKSDRDGVEVNNDISVLTLKNEAGESIKLQYHQVTTEKELWAQITDLEIQKTLNLRTGDSFGIFYIENITPTEVNVMDEENNTYQLKYIRSSESW